MASISTRYSGRASCCMNSSVFGVIFGGGGMPPNDGSCTRQAAPLDAKLPIDVFLAFFRLASLADPMSLPLIGGHQDRRIAMRPQDALQCLPATMFSFLLQRPQNVPEKMIGQHADEDMGINTFLFLMRVGSQAQVGLQRPKTILGASQADVQLPQLVFRKGVLVGS